MDDCYRQRVPENLLGDEPHRRAHLRIVREDARRDGYVGRIRFAKIPARPDLVFPMDAMWWIEVHRVRVPEITPALLAQIGRRVRLAMSQHNALGPYVARTYSPRIVVHPDVRRAIVDHLDRDPEVRYRTALQGLREREDPDTLKMWNVPVGADFAVAVGDIRVQWEVTV